MQLIIKKAKLRDLKELLKSTDYQIIKCYEASLTQKSMPYDYLALITQRDQWRDEINTLELELELLK